MKAKLKRFKITTTKKYLCHMGTKSVLKKLERRSESYIGIVMRMDME